MTDRDHFAAAALTGLLSNVQRYQNEPLTRQAFEIADFMLRERCRAGADCPGQDNARSVASAGSVAERPLGDPEVAVEILRLRVAELEEAIRRLAEQDALLSVLCKRDGSQVVTVTMDGTLTDAERDAIDEAAVWYEGVDDDERCRGIAATLRGMLERMK